MAGFHTSGGARAEPRADRRFLREAERKGTQLAVAVRLGALGLLAAWLGVFAPGLQILWPLAMVAAFAVLGVIPFIAQRVETRPRRIWIGAATVLDSLLLGVVLFMPNPLVAEHFAFPIYLRFDWFAFYLVLLAFAVLSFTPWIVILSGLASAASWLLGIVSIAWRADTLPYRPLTSPADISIAERTAAILDPRFVDLDKVEQQIVVLLIVTAVLAAGVWRVRRLIVAQARTERARTNLARYLPPTLVEELARRDRPFGGTRRARVAVLFADIKGFTQLADAADPRETIALLRDFHARMEACVFAQGGTLDKFMGDGLMATFGTPKPAGDDAARALACAVAMRASIVEMNAERAQRGRPRLSIGIGLHVGEAVIGDLGGARRMEMAVVGPTVNLAARLEGATRGLNATVIASDALIEAAGGPDAARAAGLAPQPPFTPRGAPEAMAIWADPPAGAPSVAPDAPLSREPDAA